jgi:phage anti-repressor protein
MTAELVNVHSSVIIGGEPVPAVNLRDLHQALAVSTRYNDWAQRKIEESMAVTGRDFLTLKSEYNKGRAQIDHLVTLDTAKHIAMLERNEKGRQVREYFIRVEKEFRAGRQQNNASAWLVGKLLEIAPAEDLLRLLQVRHSYGSIAKNGKARTGWRSPAYVASNHRRKDARIFHEGVIRLNVTVQLELPKLAELLEGRAA